MRDGHRACPLSVDPRADRCSARHRCDGDRMSEARARRINAPKVASSGPFWATSDRVAAAASGLNVRIWVIFTSVSSFGKCLGVSSAAANQNILQRPAVCVEMVCSASGVCRIRLPILLRQDCVQRGVAQCKHCAAASSLRFTHFIVLDVLCRIAGTERGKGSCSQSENTRTC